MSIESSTLAVIISFIVGVILSIAFYLKDKRLNETASWLRYALTTCRFFVLFAITFLLFSPLTKVEKEEIKHPVLPVLVDNSKSIGDVSPKIKQEITRFTDELANALPDVSVQLIPFSIGIELNDSLSFDKQGTSLSNSIDEIENIIPNENIGGLILISDGISTEGRREIRTLGYPIFSLGVGDPVVSPDAKIKKVFHNDVVYLGNDYSLECLFDFTFLDGIPQKIKIKFGDQLVKEFNYTPNKAKDFYKFKTKIKAKKSGDIPLVVEVLNNEKEKVVENNSITHFIKVKKKKQNVLIVTNEIHPDVRAIKSAFWELNHVNLSTTKYDDLKYDCSKVNAIIFIGNSKDESKKAWLEKVRENRIGFLWFTGTQGRYKNEFFSFQRLDDANDFIGMKLNKPFDLFKSTDKEKDFVNEGIGISVPFGKWKVSGEEKAFANQVVNNIETNLNQIVFSDHTGVNFCILIGDGYWRYSIKNQEEFAKLIRKSIDIVSVKIDDSALKIFGLEEFNLSSDIVFKAQYLNQADQLDNSRNLQCKLFQNDTLILESNYLKTDSAYRINLGSLPVGAYVFKSLIRVGSENLSVNKKFVVKEVKIESEDMIARFDVLEKLSSGGSFNTWGNRGDLVSQLTKSNFFKSVSYFESIIDLLIKHKWIFFLIIGFIVIEWFIRKWQGTI